MTFATTFLIETPEQERARLAEFPAGSINHALSTLPVLITDPLEGLLIRLPAIVDRGPLTIVVVPVRRLTCTSLTAEELRRRHGGYWKCVVVASEDPRYPVGGHNLSVSETRLVRGEQIRIGL
ncbi:hypothetical protein [Cellulomonas rhizosphaerae]|uniref:Uncharacterized protein n=1 Tax=Cellulomonas rhizosphaerae TaxID=2293719 RepID=A0A413RLS9_9CELL|nr:hypothetical protein [Cellulomonas rhizosphaerae]RHA41015.1 hypothetical protein D1825_09270 [Cellulomonas rhizosphaerae]